MCACFWSLRKVRADTVLRIYGVCQGTKCFRLFSLSCLYHDNSGMRSDSRRGSWCLAWDEEAHVCLRGSGGCPTPWSIFLTCFLIWFLSNSSFPSSWNNSRGSSYIIAVIIIKGQLYRAFFSERRIDLSCLHASRQRRRLLKIKCLCMEWLQPFNDMFTINTSNKKWKPENIEVFHREFLPVWLYSANFFFFNLDLSEVRIINFLFRGEIQWWDENPTSFAHTLSIKSACC